MQKKNKKKIDKLVEECTETVEEVKLAKKKNLSEDKSKHKYSSCMLYIVSFSIILIVNVGIVSYFV